MPLCIRSSALNLTAAAALAAETQDVSVRKGFRIIGPRLRITAARSTHVLHYDMSPTFVVQVRALLMLSPSCKSAPECRSTFCTGVQAAAPASKAAALKCPR